MSPRCGRRLIGSMQLARVLAVVLAAVGCGPSGPSEGTLFRGGESIQSAILCESREISTSGNYWMTVTTRWRAGVEIDWSSAALRTIDAEAIEHSSGSEAKVANGWTKRTDVYRLRAIAPQRAVDPPNADLGPFIVRWRVGSTAWQELRSDTCEPGLRP